MEGRIALFLGVLFIVSISSDKDCAEVLILFLNVYRTLPVLM